jgi:hypothetical protein
VKARLNSRALRKVVVVSARLSQPGRDLMLATRKITQAVNPKTLAWIPMVPFDRVWTDTAVLTHLGFSASQKKYIRSLYVHIPKGAHQ